MTKDILTGAQSGIGRLPFAHEPHASTNGVTTSLGSRKPDMGFSVTWRAARMERSILGMRSAFSCLAERPMAEGNGALIRHAPIRDDVRCSSRITANDHVA